MRGSDLRASVHFTEIGHSRAAYVLSHSISSSRFYVDASPSAASTGRRHQDPRCRGECLDETEPGDPWDPWDPWDL